MLGHITAQEAADKAWQKYDAIEQLYTKLRDEAKRKIDVVGDALTDKSAPHDAAVIMAKRSS